MSVSAHHDETGLPATDLIEDERSRRVLGDHGLERDTHAVGGEELASQLEPGLGPGWVLVDGEETHGLVPRHPEKGERLKRAGDLPAAAVGHQHTLARSRLAGDDHHWARALAEHLVAGGIGIVLRLELEVGLPAEHDHVASDCLGDDLLVRRSDIPRGSVFESAAMSHLDPLAAVPGRNQFLKTVVPWLRRLP